MAKRKNKLLLSDLLPELAAREWVEEEKEEPARKVQKTGEGRSKFVSEARLTKAKEEWNGRLEVAKQWKRTKGRFPKHNNKDKEELSLYNWLKRNMLGGQCWDQERW